jgi:mRNA interferase HigB
MVFLGFAMDELYRGRSWNATLLAGSLPRIVSRRKLREFWETPGRSDSVAALRTWFDVVSSARWRSYGGTVDLAYGRYIFDIRGNRYRLVCVIDFVRHGVLILWIGTHAEYDWLNRYDGVGLKAL